jgi:DNA-binding transcriptional ArsR family regulator
MKKVLTNKELNSLADFFKVLSEESRLRILNALCKGALNVTQITETTGLEQANVSRHLKMLTQAGILKRTSQGVTAIYEIKEKKVLQLCEFVSQELI